MIEIKPKGDEAVYKEAEVESRDGSSLDLMSQSRVRASLVELEPFSIRGLNKLCG